MRSLSVLCGARSAGKHVCSFAQTFLCGDRCENETCSSCSAASGPVCLFTGPG